MIVSAIGDLSGRSDTVPAISDAMVEPEEVIGHFANEAGVSERPKLGYDRRQVKHPMTALDLRSHP
jgi:hypothetical protein